MEKLASVRSLERKKAIASYLARKQIQHNQWTYDGVGPQINNSLLLQTAIDAGKNLEPLHNTSGYDVTFHQALAVIGVTTIQELLLERHKKGKPNRILDLYGGGYFRDTEIIDTITAVRLPDATDETILSQYRRGYTDAQVSGNTAASEYYSKRIEEMEKILLFPDRNVLHQNLYDSQVWEMLKSKVFDLVTIRPEGGLYIDEYMMYKDMYNLYPENDPHLQQERHRRHNNRIFKPYADIFFSMFLRTKQLMSSDGVMLGQIPNQMPDVFSRRFEHVVNAYGDGKLVIFPAPMDAKLDQLGTFIYQKAA